MAKIAVNRNLNNSGYTVPAGKYFVGNIFVIDPLTASPANITIAGQVIGRIYNSSGNSYHNQKIGPVCANAGETISAAGNAVGMSGFLYDA